MSKSIDQFFKKSAAKDASAQKRSVEHENIEFNRNESQFSVDSNQPINSKIQQQIQAQPKIINNQIEDVLFQSLVEVYEQIGEIKGQNSKDQIKELVSKIFLHILKTNPDSFIQAYLFSIIKLGPDYESWELGIGQTIIIKSISAVTGKTDKQVRELNNTLGDLGLAVEKAKSSQTSLNKFFISKGPKVEIKLTLNKVFNTLQQMQRIEGTGSSTEKERMLTQLLREAKPIEAKYIVRFIEKNLKIGAAEKTMQAALARAFVIYHDNKISGDFESVINQALCECPNYQKLIESLKQIQHLDEIPQNCHIIPGVPCKPMLAKPMKSIQMIFTRFNNIPFTCEYKYDGLRGQIHFQNGIVQIFSRNLENMTQAYPDIVNFIQQHYHHLDSFIIDSEIVAYDLQNNRILPFQTLSSRAKKNVAEDQINIQVCLYMFDLLYLNGKSYLKSTLQQRRQALRTSFSEIQGKLQFATSKDSESFEEIEELLLNSIKQGCEGLMIKTLDINSEYEPAKRSFNWLKLKKDYLDNGLSDTFDLVPIGALFGAGKRKGLYGSYLLACYNEDMDTYELICKIGTGFSDENLEVFHKQLQEHIIPQPLTEYKSGNLQMDVWFKPSVVWEVKGADIQVSPIYSACSTLLNQQNKGVGLRFPRLIKVREDKKPHEATTSSFIFEIYQQQAVVASNMVFNQDDDYY